MKHIVHCPNCKTPDVVEVKPEHILTCGSCKKQNTVQVEALAAYEQALLSMREENKALKAKILELEAK